MTMADPMCYYCTNRATTQCSRCGNDVCRRHVLAHGKLCVQCGPA